MSAHPKHPLHKIYESGAETIDLQACKGMTSRPDVFQAAVERLKAAEREKERDVARILKQWNEFCRRLYDTLWHFRVATSQRNLPVAITDPPRMSIVVPSDAVPVWREAEVIRLMDFVRSAFAVYAPTDHFPLAFTEPDARTIIIPPRRISFDTASRILSIYTAAGFERMLKQILWDTERLRIVTVGKT